MIKIVTACWLLLFSTNLWADDMRPASLTITALDNNRFDVIWKVPAKGKQRLKLDVTFDISDYYNDDIVEEEVYYFESGEDVLLTIVLELVLENLVLF